MFVAMISLAAALVAGQQQAQPSTAVTGQQPASAPTSPAQTADAVSTATPGTFPVATLGTAPSVSGERVVCTSTQVTGSRFPIRRCRSVSQLNAERNEAQDQLNQAQVNRMPPPT